jgi:thymidylate synthase (FAD)
MLVQLVARPQFIGLPAGLGTPGPSQLQGPDAQKLIETAGRTCYDSFGKGRESNAFARHLIEVGHGSVMEHAQYSFFISGVSRGLTHELVRHRVGIAISQRSTRYVDESHSPWAYHPLLRQIDDFELLERWDMVQEVADEVYGLTVQKLQEMLEKRGLDKTTARKQARGAARGILGNALATELIWSANVRSLRHVIELRGHPSSDGEIRFLAAELLDIMKEELPIYFEDLVEGPKAKDGAPVVEKVRNETQD